VDINCRNPPVHQLHGDVQEDGPLEVILRDQGRPRDGVNSRIAVVSMVVLILLSSAAKG